MKVVNIINSASNILGLKSVIASLPDISNASEEVQNEIANLLISVNMTNNNIATNYVQLIRRTTLANVSGLISFDDITDQSIIEIKRITNENNQTIPFKILANGVETQAGNVTIEYSVFPDVVTILDDIDYYLKINELIFATGVVSEYLYLKGVFDEANLWADRFKSMILVDKEIVEETKAVKNINMPSRRWY